MAYGNNPSGSSRDAVRLLVGDISTSTAAEWLANGDYDWFVAATPNIYSAAALVARSLAGLFATDASEKQVGDLKLKRPSPSDMLAMAKRWEKWEALSVSPSAGGVTDPSGATQSPYFVRRQFDNPEGYTTPASLVSS